MKPFVLGALIPACVASALLGSASCTADCEDKGTCGPYSATGGSAGSSSGAGGKAGSGGAGGKGGAAGSGGASGSLGVGGGGGAGESGQAGEAGTSNGGTAGRGGAGGTGGKGGAGGEAGMMGGEAGTAGVGPSCDGTKSPDEDTCVIGEDYGVFVSPSGRDDTGDGSRKKPYATLAKAIDRAASSDKRVYACADGGPYKESVSIGASAGGIALFGGFSCTGWSYSTTRQSRVTSATTLALHVDGAAGVRIEDFRFDAADGTLPGESSVGAFVANSTGVVLRGTTIVAGKGVDGANGVLEAFEYQAQSALDGNSESPATMGGGERVCACQSPLMSVGGGGGPPSTSGQAGAKGLPDHGAGMPGTPGTCGSTGTGDDGANAPATPPALGATTLGSLDTTGWSPAPGQDGQIGQPGQGGGGGASRTALGHGGGGGCGSCGGNGGKAGQGGGASIALLILDSEVTIEASKLTSADAGHGGNGRAGQLAQTEVGSGGSVVSNLNSCPGGAGGLGADGGASGGGAGGISVGILWKGALAPSRSGLTVTTGTLGIAGLGGEPGVNDGVDGVVAEVREAP